MTEPKWKSLKDETFIFLNKVDKSKDAFALKMFGRTLTESKARLVCVICGSPSTEFSDEKSRKEYEISGLCQSCQDAVFNE